MLYAGNWALALSMNSCTSGSGFLLKTRPYVQTRSQRKGSVRRGRYFSEKLLEERKTPPPLQTSKAESGPLSPLMRNMP